MLKLTFVHILHIVLSSQGFPFLGPIYFLYYLYGFFTQM